MFLRVLLKVFPGVLHCSNGALLIEHKFFSSNNLLEGIFYFHEMLQKEATKTEKMCLFQNHGEILGTDIAKKEGWEQDDIIGSLGH